MHTHTHTHRDTLIRSDAVQSVCFISKLSRRSISSNNTVSTVFCLSAPGGAEQFLLSKNQS